MTDTNGVSSPASFASLTAVADPSAGAPVASPSSPDVSQSTTLTTNPSASDNAWIMGKPLDVTLTSTDAGVGPWKISYKVTTGPVSVSGRTLS